MTTTYSRPRARLIYPETLDSAQIRELAKNPLHLLIWYALYHYLDDQGRAECRVSTIQAQCLRHLPEGVVKDRVVADALDRMRTIKDDDGIPLIYTYPSDPAYPEKGTLVLQMAKWWEYQQGMKNAWPSRWPKPPAEVVPTWTDQFLGYGKKVYQKAVQSGEIVAEDWGQNGPNDSPSVGENIPDKFKYKNKDSKESSTKPFDLLAAYLEERGLPVGQFPGMSIQLAHAKKMLAEGMTPDDVREATRLLAQDEFWARKGFDLATIRSQWVRLKSAAVGRQPKRRAPRKLVDEHLPAD